MCIRDRPPACPRGAGRMRCSGHTTALGFPACPVTSPTPPGPFQPLAVTGPLLLVTRDGEFVTITMNWLERRNVLSLGLVRELARAFTSTAEGDSLGIVLAANGRSSAPVTTCPSSPLWTCRGAVPGGAAVSHPYRPFGPGPRGRLTAMGRGKLRVYLGAAPHGRQPPMRARTKRTIRVRHRSAARDRPPTGPEWRARAGRDRR